MKDIHIRRVASLLKREEDLFKFENRLFTTSSYSFQFKKNATLVKGSVTDLTLNMDLDLSALIFDNYYSFLFKSVARSLCTFRVFVYNVLCSIPPLIFNNRIIFNPTNSTSGLSGQSPKTGFLSFLLFFLVFLTQEVFSNLIFLFLLL